MKNKFNQFAAIESIKKNDDGTLIVSGYASSGGTDSDGEIITPEAMAASIPDYMKFGAVREMHGKSAAGTALEIEVQEDGRTAFSAHIVDPVAVLKVETGVYKGFSIGGNVSSRDKLNKSTITGLKLIEVSLVDRPANPEALITMFKADESGKPEAETEPLEPVTKGLYSVSDFACALSGLQWIVADSQWEAESEGDNSPVPAQLRAWLKTGFDIFQSMAAEEMSEAMAMLMPPPDPMAVDQVEYAAFAELKKSGMKFSKETIDKLVGIHASIKSAHEGLSGLGYDMNANGEENDDANGQTEEQNSEAPIKAEFAIDDDNALAKREELSKSLDLVKADLALASEALEKAHKEIEVLKAQPVEPKSALFATPTSIDKSSDALSAAAPVQNPHPQGTIAHAEWIAKAILNGTFQK